MKPLIIIGAGGLGREVAWLAERINGVNPKWEIKGFIDDSIKAGEIVGSYPVLGNWEIVGENLDAYYVCGIGAAKVRKSVIEKINNTFNNINYATLVDPTVQMSERVAIGGGSIICAGSVLTVDIEIGKHTIINLNCTIGHDAVLKDYVTLHPTVNVSGNVLLGNCVEMGTGSRIIQGITIGENTIIGSGAVVVRDLPENTTAVGVPAKVIKNNG